MSVCGEAECADECCEDGEVIEVLEGGEEAEGSDCAFVEGDSWVRGEVPKMAERGRSAASMVVVEV